MVTSRSSRVTRSPRRVGALVAVVSTALVLGGCAMTPKPLTLEEQIVRAAQDRAVMYASQEPISGPVSLEEAIARAVAYNLDHRVALMQRALEDRALDVATVDLLPEVVGRAGYRTRDNVQASSSRSIISGRVSDSSSLFPSNSAG